MTRLGFLLLKINFLDVNIIIDEKNCCDHCQIHNHPTLLSAKKSNSTNEVTNHKIDRHFDLKRR